MYRRVKQFIRAITAKIEPADELFLADYLTAAEQRLFRQMNLPDQQHSLYVAYTAQQLAAHSPGVRLRLLTRAALLHDVGRTKNDLSTVGKVLAVLFSTVLPGFARQWAEAGHSRRNNFAVKKFRDGMFVYYNHGDIGARLLRELGTETELIELVARHHRPAAGDDAWEISILRQADQLN